MKIGMVILLLSHLANSLKEIQARNEIQHSPVPYQSFAVSGELPAGYLEKQLFDLTTIELLNAARSLRSGRDLSGNDLHGTPHLFLGSTVNPGSSDLAREVENSRRKIDAGSQFFQSQAIYDIGLLARFLDAAKLGSVALLAGVIPLKSANMAAWLNANVPGIRVAAAILEELERAGPEGEAAKGVEIAARTIRQLRNICNGVHVMAIGWEDRIPEILGAAGVSAH